MKHCFLLYFLVLTGSVTSAFKVPTQSVTPTLHVIYVLEVGDREYGLLNSSNDTLMTQLMKTVAFGLNYRRRTTYLPKTSFSSVALKKIITTLKTRPRDIIVVYYSGYGIVSTQSTASFANWKLKDTAMKGLAVSEVEKWLLARKVHLGWIIADCSSQFLTSAPYPRGVGPGPDLRKQVIQRLFLSNCGIVKMGSSLPLLPSWINKAHQGSVFTNALMEGMGNLLSAPTRADIQKASFQKLSDITAGFMSSNLGKLPFVQVPVLEINKCQRPSRLIVQRPTIDPLGNETLSNLFSAVMLNQNMAQTRLFSERLTALAQDSAVVEVIQQIYDQSDTPKTLPDSATYSLTTYLTRQPQLGVEDSDAISLKKATLRSISVQNTELDRAASKPIRRVKIQEQWVLDNP
ncbi:hypothetical protein [Fibrella aquatica]|uniref:hypothetical protein n=1 Tax=Fibrella aquatica TaxID=3242487 RepID=UPI0035216EB1